MPEKLAKSKIKVWHLHFVFFITRKITCFFLRIKYLGKHNVIFQQDAYGCGISCIKMILKDNDFEYEIPDKSTMKKNKHCESVDRKYVLPPPVTKRKHGLSMLEMSCILKAYSFTAKGYECKDVQQLQELIKANSSASFLVIMENFDNIMLSHLIHFILSPFRFFNINKKQIRVRKIYHWAVVDQINSSSIILRDPFLGKVEIGKSKMENLWSKYILVVTN